jgi:SAM-dependent methyltransferase
MTTEADIPVVDRILQLLQHLGIERAHFAGAVPGDWRGLAARHAAHFASLSLVCPTGFERSIVAALASRVLVFHGDEGPTAERVRGAVAGLPDATLMTLPNYTGLLFADVAAERKEEISPALLEFLRRMEQKEPSRAVTTAAESGEIAGLSYRIRGSGPPLVLLPLALAPSQWEPLLPQLSQTFCTITLGGPHLGIMPILEGRGQAPGYVRLVRNVLHEVALRPGEAILDAGCGSGVVDRWIAQHTNRAHAITGVDINRYLLREAESLVERAGLQNVVKFQEGNAEALPFREATFDVGLSITVMEEGDAEQMLTELLRVTKPGGRVAAIVRGDDCPALLTLPLRPEVSAKAARAVGAGVVARGCADASLYPRFHAAGMVQVRKLPQLAVYDDPQNVMAQYYQSRILSALTPDEADDWRAAVTLAEAEGAFVLAVPHHCAIGTKPSS